MRVITLDAERASQRLDYSVEALARTAPELSAKSLFTRRQLVAMGIFLAAVVVSGAFEFVNVVIALLAIATAFYIAVTLNRVLLFARASRRDNTYVISDEEARAVPDDDLPVYSVLVPAYREPEVIQALIAHVDRIEYPRGRLDVKLLLEADDEDTIAAVAATNPPDYLEVVLVPPAEPRTKPKALNFALGLCRGEIVTIYDAEDDPDPLQLRRAVVALDRAGSDMACIQAKLSFGNWGQNLITGWFTIEYAMWFTMFLPGLVSLNAPLPLGGTSNHFRRDILEELGAWDPYNVTEDADLGIRLARMGYHCGVLDSTTLEEANSDFVNWVKQRSRWYKGYLQTAVVHLRRPVVLYQQLGYMGFAQLILFVLGTPLLAALNPAFWLLTLLWFVGHPHYIKTVFPAPLFYPAVLCWVFGNFVVAYLTVLTCRLMKRYELLWAALVVPLYWIMMAIAAIKALWQLIATPSFWEKTVHGLDSGSLDVRPPEPAAPNQV